MFMPIRDPISHLDESILVTNNPCALPEAESPKWGGPVTQEIQRLQQALKTSKTENEKLRLVWGEAKKDFEEVKFQNQELQK